LVPKMEVRKGERKMISLQGTAPGTPKKKNSATRWGRTQKEYLQNCPRLFKKGGPRQNPPVSGGGVLPR